MKENRFSYAEEVDNMARMKVVGVGGAGGNALNWMIQAGLRGVEFISVNTDIQALELSKAPRRIQIGRSLTRGRGAGSNPEIGRKAAEEDRDTICQSLDGIDMVFVTAGMGGGTGTGAAPVIAAAAREIGALTLAIVTKPFSFEGRKRMQQAEAGLEELKEHVDAMIIIPNERLISLVEPTTSLIDAFHIVDDILLKATRGISDLVNVPGIVNLDFADVRAVMNERGDALMGEGRAQGEDRALKAAQEAISSPLLEDISINGARGILVNITGGSDMTLHDIAGATQAIRDAAGEDADVRFGAVIDQEARDDISVTVIATGFDRHSMYVREEQKVERADSLPSFQHVSRKFQKNPTIRRLTQTVNGELQPVIVGDESLPLDNLEIPAFLRQ
ncbi:cell division protein FtsZ [bacterium]|nr:cell division protein FtsZ [bacterium]MBU1936116.1 cell division protein FtsZ [bacterium]